MMNENFIKRLIFVIQHLEEKLSSLNETHDQLKESMSLLADTQENIRQDLTNIKSLFNKKLNEDEIQSEKVEENLPETSSDSSLNLQRSIPLCSRIESIDLNQNESLSINEQEQKNQFTSSIHPSFTRQIFKENHLEIIPQLAKESRNIRIDQIESRNGDYLRLLNLSNSNDYDLSEHFIQQNIYSQPFCRFRFPLNTIIQARQTVTIWCGLSQGIIPQPPHLFLWKEQRKWETIPECRTILAKPNGQVIASYRNSPRDITDQSSSDILYVHSKRPLVSSEVSSTSTNSIRSVSRRNTRESRFSSFHFFGNTKPPFAHSPTHPIHPDYNGTILHLPNNLRSQIHEKENLFQLRNRAKSSPFASHIGCKQDLLSMNSLRIPKQRQTPLKN